MVIDTLELSHITRTRQSFLEHYAGDPLSTNIFSTPKSSTTSIDFSLANDNGNDAGGMTTPTFLNTHSSAATSEPVTVLHNTDMHNLSNTGFSPILTPNPVTTFKLSPCLLTRKRPVNPHPVHIEQNDGTFYTPLYSSPLKVFTYIDV